MKVKKENFAAKLNRLIEVKSRPDGTQHTQTEAVETNPLSDPNFISDVLPRHIAIAMDGNGRWAQQRRQPRTAGHRIGADVAREIILFSRAIGIEVLTLYAFSMENWGRDSREVAVILDELLPLALSDNYEEFNRLGIRIEVLGEEELLSERTQRVIDVVRTATQTNTGLIVNIAVSYSGRLEILKAVRRVIEALEQEQITRADLNEALFAQYLDSGHLPFPDLYIRCGGVNRISNFMLWQMAYTEIVSLDTLWPDFRPEHLCEAIRTYQGQPRKFGLVLGDH
jgi:undecaprenyl diphosphate synthase